jgi:hypothetical protein
LALMEGMIRLGNGHHLGVWKLPRAGKCNKQAYDPWVAENQGRQDSIKAKHPPRKSD